MNFSIAPDMTLISDEKVLILFLFLRKNIKVPDQTENQLCTVCLCHLLFVDTTCVFILNIYLSKQCRPRPDSCLKSSLVRVYTVTHSN